MGKALTDEQIETMPAHDAGHANPEFRQNA